MTIAEYLVSIYGGEAAFENPTSEYFNQMMEGHAKFGEKHHGSLRGGNALQPSSTATSIRGDESGKFAITDGAFAETKEVLAATTSSRLPTWTKQSRSRRTSPRPRAVWKFDRFET